MSEHSKIEWTDHTFNPWSGCVKVSPACQHCYAAALPPAYRRHAVWGARTDRMPASDSYWAQPLAWDRKARKAGVRARVFCASTADVFEDRDDLDPLRERLWDLIQKTPNLDWLLLTKRPEIMFYWSEYYPWPSNAWAGTTVESQEWADRRIPWLLKVPAQIRFLSVEPMLGAVDLSVCTNRSGIELDSEGAPHFNPLKGFTFFNSGDHGVRIPRLSWLICGGESGPNARPSHPDWFRSLRDQCREAGVPFLFKQNGEWVQKSQSTNQGLWVLPDGTTKRHWIGDPGPSAYMVKVGKSAAGRLLDGVEHNEFPKAGQV